MQIQLENIDKKYDHVFAVKNVSLSVHDGEIMALLGPSGCGKTTLLRMISGLIPMTNGKIFFDDKDVSLLHAKKRNTAMVFQNYALFPHLTVHENVAFGLKIRKYSKKEIADSVRNILKAVEMEDYENRRIQDLSGGQRQRVALARALVIKPDILLFDEPLSNLDENLRVTMRTNIKEIQRNFGITSIYVTHDQEEAMSIADRITIMNEGEIQQCDTPRNIYETPKNLFTADFIGKANFFIVETDLLNKDRTIQVLNRKIALEPNTLHNPVAMIRPEYFKISDHGTQGIVTLKEDLGAITRYKIKIEERYIFLDEMGSQLHKDIQIGDSVKISFQEDKIVLFEKDVKRRDDSGPVKKSKILVCTDR
ncbi:ATP-binding cassette domain-containing protein [Acetobacterium paludosum]|uniref:ATP-binding cassette domain-containing protein n=1 Tax=Acetobacterium paludosum TaxID=52693 RepID=A0A923KP56_9FIRM|nr:ABC transporter ATP-binding protein [Acetobacterium paludosum]MBC3887794.1 ATP-binding cassette domain-containing protein [Acetobacterium paludosum]